MTVFSLESFPLYGICTAKYYATLLHCTSNLYHISSKSHRGEILFPGPVWCGDNSRAARFRGQHLQRSACTCAHSFNNKPICMHINNIVMSMHIHVEAVDPLPCSEILRVAFIGMSWQKRAVTFRGQWDFEVWRDFEEIWYLPSLLRLWFYIVQTKANDLFKGKFFTI